MLTKKMPQLELGGRTKLGLHLVIISMLLAALSLTLFSSPDGVQAERFVSPAFERYWSRADFPVVAQVVQRGFVWGSEPFFNTYEQYQESPNQRRLVQYFDKTRMELTRPQPDGNPNSPFYVTNGLLAKELILGTLQTGDNTYNSRYPAFDIPLAGDPVEVNEDAPTYASLFNISAVQLPNFLGPLPSPLPCGTTSGTSCSTNIRTNETVVDVLNKDGSLGRSVGLGTIAGTRYVYYDRTLKHNIPQVFYDYLTQTGLVFDGRNYVTASVFDWISTFGYPITDAYWTSTRVGGVLKNVMVQAFERRILTFTPGNPSGYEVEMGNVGRHYYNWRYNPKYDISIPACAFCNVTPQAAFPGATFVIRTERIFLNLGGQIESVQVVIIYPDGKIVPLSATGGVITNAQQDSSDLGRLRIALTTSTRAPRGTYTVIMTGNTTGQQAKAFFNIINIPGVAINFV